MPQGKSSTVKITTVELPKTSYGGYWAGMTFHRGIPLPVTPLNQRWKMTLQSESDHFHLLRKEGEIDNQYKAKHAEFELSNQLPSGLVDIDGTENYQTFYGVATNGAARAVNVDIIEEA